MQNHDVNKVCQSLEINRSSYYQKRKERENNSNEELVVYLFKKHKGNKGKRSLQKLLQRRKIKLSLPKIARILRENKLIAKGGIKKRKFKQEVELITPEYNLVKNKFETTRLNTLLCADICQIRCKNGWLYISGIMDVANREIVGYQIEKHMRKELVIESIKMAARKYRYTTETIFHRDNGSQYKANATKELLESMGIRPGKPMDNQPIESFWKTLRREMDDISNMCFNQARRIVLRYIIIEYNGERLHSSLNYNTPLEVRKGIAS